MSDPRDHDELKELWRAQDSEIDPLPSAEMKKRADKFVRQIRVRNALEWMASAVVIVAMARFVASPGLPLLSRAGAAWSGLAAIYISVRLYRSGRVRKLPDPAESTQAYLHEYGARLREQASLLAAAPYWYVAPLAIGAILFVLGLWIRDPGSGARSGLSMAIMVAVFAGVAWLNRRASKKLFAKAEALGTSGAND